jgi:hypothetical protein
MEDKLYKGFYDPTQEFSKDPRAFCYELAEEFIKKSKQTNPENWYEEKNTVKGVLLLLFTWNFAAISTKKLDFKNVGELIRANKDKLKSLEKYSIEKVDDNAWSDIRDVFEQFRGLLGQTGASKALSLLHPALFVMWDTAIRSRLNKELIKGIDEGQNGDCYVTFLKGIQEIIKKYHIKEKLFLDQNSTIVKKVDEYNYVELVMKKRYSG